MKEASEAIKKAIEAIESAAPEAWRLTVEGYAAEVWGALLHDCIWGIGSLLCAWLTVTRWKPLYVRMAKEFEKKIRDQDDGVIIPGVVSTLLAAIAIVALTVSGVAALAEIPWSVARLTHIEGYAAKQLVEGALR